MTYEEYRAIDAISASDLKEMSRSMAHYKYYKDNPKPQTPTMAFGSAVHAAILEPAEFNAKYAVFDDTDYVSALRANGAKNARNKNDYRAYKSAFESDNAGKVILSSEDYTSVVKIAREVHNHPTVGAWLANPNSQFEKSLFWQNGNTKMKARADHIIYNMVIDYKTTSDARPSAFQRDIYKYGYYIQAGVYCEAVAAECGIDIARFVFVAIETEAPYAIALYELDADTIAYGQSEASRLLCENEACVESGVWTGYKTDIQELSLPIYAYSE